MGLSWEWYMSLPTDRNAEMIITQEWPYWFPLHFTLHFNFRSVLCIKQKSSVSKKGRQKHILVESESTISLVGMKNGAATLESSLKVKNSYNMTQ